jgi:hypothetical protein
MVTQAGATGLYYFTMALMNHNSEKCLNVELRNSMDDWGASQIVSCADWAVQGKVSASELERVAPVVAPKSSPLSSHAVPALHHLPLVELPLRARAFNP